MFKLGISIEQIQLHQEKVEMQENKTNRKGKEERREGEKGGRRNRKEEEGRGRKRKEEEGRGRKRKEEVFFNVWNEGEARTVTQAWGAFVY